MEENNIFTGKTLEEAVNNACLATGFTKDELEIEVLEEGRKKLFGSVKWKIRATEKQSDAQRSANYVKGLLNIMGIQAECESSLKEDNIYINIKTADSPRVIGKHGEILDAIQCMAGAIANIGKEKYAKVVVDCENYRSQREATLTALAEKVAKKAVDTGRKVALEPMNAYERRIIHSALSENKEVKTLSEGKEPGRHIVVIPENLNPDSKVLKYDAPDRRPSNRDRRRDRRSAKTFRKNDRGAKPASGEKRAKKEIRFGTFLGNSGEGNNGNKEE